MWESGPKGNDKHGVWRENKKTKSSLALNEYKVDYADNTSDYLSPADFDGIEVILET